MHSTVLCRCTYKKENAFLNFLDNTRYRTATIHEYNTLTRICNVVLTWQHTHMYVFNNNKTIGCCGQ